MRNIPTDPLAGYQQNQDLLEGSHPDGRVQL